MAFGNRVQKSAAGPKRRRGRPKKYTASWTKKLVVLRLCGLQLGDILRILTLQGNGTITAKDRRPQQLLRQLLSDGEHRFCAPDKLTARKRAAFIRTIGLRHGETRKRKSDPAPLSSYIPTQPLERCLAPSGSSNTLSSEVKQAIRPVKLWLGAVTVAGVNGLPETSYSSLRSSNPQINECEAIAAGSRLIHQQTEALLTGDINSPGSRDMSVHSRDSEVFSSRRHSKIREVLNRGSYSSSFVSDLLSILDKNFSASNLTTSSRFSASMASLAENETSSMKSKVEKILQLHQQKYKEANAVVIRDCCLIEQDCVHKFIRKVTISDPFLINISPTALETKLRVARDLHESDPYYGPSVLFFAARSGAPADVLLSLVRRTTVNTVNAAGQTFLFFLDPQGFCNRGCNCGGKQSHTSKFECLISALTYREFNFDHVDNHGRHFLFFLCASSSFNIQWLTDIMLRDYLWAERIGRISQLRDSTGTFLLDFMSAHASYENFSEDIRSRFRPLFVHNPSQTDLPGVLPDEDAQGRTPLHVYLQTDYLRNEHVRWDMSTADLNRYDTLGRTPIMRFLERAFEQGIDESFICGKVKELVLAGGVNPNACSRGGSTMLHFAAKKALPKLLKTLLMIGVQAEHCDDQGFNALNYAAQVFNRSKSVKATPELTARSLRSAAKLLDVVTNNFGRSRAHPPLTAVTSTFLGPADRAAITGRASLSDLAERSLQSMNNLSGGGIEKFPQSMPKYVQHGKRYFQL